MNQMKLTQPPSPRDMIKIALGLTVVCLISALILGALYYVTEPIRVKNIQAREATTIQHLLGLEDTARIDEVRRYLTPTPPVTSVYLTPFVLICFDQNGKEKFRKDLADIKVPLTSPEDKDRWVKDMIQQTLNVPVTYVGRFFVGKKAENILGFVVEATTVGFKSHIRFFIAMDSAFSVRGIEIIEQEEDPGLGAEIAQDYFKYQFSGRSAQDIESLKVIKDPLPREWKTQLEALSHMDYEDWMTQTGSVLSAHRAIHAITGATISSKAVTDGLKLAVSHFRFRLALLKEVL